MLNTFSARQRGWIYIMCRVFKELPCSWIRRKRKVFERFPRKTASTRGSAQGGIWEAAGDARSQECFEMLVRVHRRWANYCDAQADGICLEVLVYLCLSIYATDVSCQLWLLYVWVFFQFDTLKLICLHCAANSGLTVRCRVRRVWLRSRCNSWSRIFSRWNERKFIVL